MPQTTLLFRTGQSSRGGEQDFLVALENIVITPQLALEYARSVISTGDTCRIGVLVLSAGAAVAQPAWRVKRYRDFEDIPQGAFFELMPGKVYDLEDDMEVLVNLAPWVAVFPE